MRVLCIAGLLSLAMAVALPAEATITTVEFKVIGQWYQPVGSEAPFGFDPDSTIFGSFTVDNPTDSGIVYGGIVDALVQVGTRTFTLADVLQQGVIVLFREGAPYQWQLPVVGGTEFTSSAGSALRDGTKVLGCAASCTTQLSPPVPPEPHSSAPEPGTWLLTILGLGLVGVALRRYRPTVVAA